MNCWVNVHIRPEYDTITKQIEDIKLLEFKKSRLEARISSLCAELENIPAAIEQFGYVDLTYDNGKKSMKIIREPALPAVGQK